MHLLLRYTQALLTQKAQTAACNRHHSLGQQLCSWLLLTQDRLPGYELPMTQELISRALGVRREGITSAARHLQASGLIRYQRGHITLLDRVGLEQSSCECYGIVRREYGLSRQAAVFDNAQTQQHRARIVQACGSKVLGFL